MVALSSSGTAAGGTVTKRKAKPVMPEPVMEQASPEASVTERPNAAKAAKPVTEPASPGTSREAIAYTIVMQLAQAEGKLTPDDPQALPTFTRQWMFDAFTFAWKCLQVPDA